MGENSAQDLGYIVSHDISNLIKLKALKEIGLQAVWSVSTCKPGYGVSMLRDSKSDTYWQSDGYQPHMVNIQFRKKTTVHSIAINVDYKSDESYTPSKISIRIGSDFNDLKEIEKFPLNEPSGWIWFRIKDRPQAKPVRTFMIQIAILQNHQNGRDTHLRQIKIFSAEKEESHWNIILAQSFSTKLMVASDVSTAETKPTDSNHLMIYRNLFKVKRKEHLSAVQKLLLNPDIAKKSSLIKIMLTAIIKTIKSSFDRLEDLSLNFDEDFPSDMTAKDVYSQILENTALFTDIIIRFPHISRPFYQKSKKSWKPVMKQAIEFCNQSPVFDGDYQILLHNLRQELGIGVRDETYQNPFEEKDGGEKELSSEERKLLYKEAKRKKKVKDSTKKRSVPKISSRVEL